MDTIRFRPPSQSRRIGDAATTGRTPVRVIGGCRPLCCGCCGEQTDRYTPPSPARPARRRRPCGRIPFLRAGRGSPPRGREWEGTTGSHGLEIDDDGTRCTIGLEFGLGEDGTGDETDEFVDWSCGARYDPTATGGNTGGPAAGGEAAERAFARIHQHVISVPAPAASGASGGDPFTPGAGPHRPRAAMRRGTRLNAASATATVGAATASMISPQSSCLMSTEDARRSIVLPWDTSRCEREWYHP